MGFVQGIVFIKFLFNMICVFIERDLFFRFCVDYDVRENVW